MVRGLPAEWGSCSRTVVIDDKPQTLGYWKDTIAVGLCSGNIVTLDGITGSQVAVFSGHTYSVACVTFSADGRSLVSGSGDKTVKLWDVQTGGVVKTFHGHTGWVFSVSISSNNMIASGSIDNTICLWNIQTGECHHIIGQLGCVFYVGFSPTNPSHLISTSSDGFQQWDINGHQIKPMYKGSHAAFSMDGTHFALCEGKVTTVRNSDSGVITAKCPTKSDNSFGGSDVNSKCCCFSPDGKLVAIAAGATVYIWDITGSDPYLIETFIGHTGDITYLAFSSSFLISLSYDESIKFWQIGASSTNLVVSGPKHIPPVPASVMSVSLQAEDGIAISSDSDGVVKIWDISTGLCKALFQTPAKGRILPDAQMIDGKLVVVWLENEEIDVWGAERGELLQAIEVAWDRPNALRISGDGSKVFFLDGKSIQAWSIQTGEAVGGVELQDEQGFDLFHMGGSRICVDFYDSPIQGWDFGISGASPLPLPNISSERPRLEWISRYHSGLPQIKDTVTGKVVLQLSGRYVDHRDVQWDGQYLVAGYESGEVLILDLNQILSHSDP